MSVLLLSTPQGLAAYRRAHMARATRHHRAAHFGGGFAFRTASRRQAGIVATASCYALAAFSGRFGYWAPYPGCAAASSFSAVQAPVTTCHFCGGRITTAGTCACFGPAHV